MPTISRSRPPRRSARCRGWSSPPPRPASPMSSAPSSASGRRCRRRRARRRARRSSIDQATRANLELVRTLAGERRGSLLAAIDRTVTAAGSRLLAQRLAAPLTDPAAIARRLDAVEAFVDRRRRAPADPRAPQRRARPGARAVAAGGRPRRPARPRRDPRRHRGGRRARRAARRARRASPPRSPTRSPRCAARSGARRASLRAALADELPLFKRDGGFVRAGYDAGARRGARAARRIPPGDRRSCRRATPTRPACAR